MELTRRSAFKLIGGAVMSFGPLRLCAPGEPQPEFSWSEIHFSGWVPAMTSSAIEGRWHGVRNDGTMFYSWCRLTKDLLGELWYQYPPGILDIADLEISKSEAAAARAVIDTFLRPGCYCSANPRRVCPFHQELFMQDENGGPITVIGERDA